MSIARNRLLSALKQTYVFRMTSMRNSSHMNKKPKNAVYQTTGSLSLDCKVRAFSAQSLRITSQNEKHELMAVWPDVVRDITEACQEVNIPDLTERLRRVLEYNVPGGKNVSALNLLYAYQMLVPSDQLTRENLYLARILAWCIEVLQGATFVLDDVQDRALIRRRQPCWYQLKDIGFAAVNDGIMIESVMYYLLRKHFKRRDCYVDLFETFQEITMITLMGQALEFTNFCNTLDLDKFTMDLFTKIACHKESHIMFVLPMKLVMHLVGIKNKELHKEATEMGLKIGHLYQVQDDYLDCYGNPEILGKGDNDIKEGKCTWLAVNALERATPEQRNIMQECYGINDSEKIERVKQLYSDLDLPRIFFTYEKDTYNLLNNQIEQMSCELPREAFRMILDEIYQREK